MNLDDLPRIEQIDHLAFVPIWLNSKESLRVAYQQAAVASVAEENGHIVGYQISTATAGGGHLARLAVTPSDQGLGVGSALLQDALSTFQRRGAHTVTVNTQKENFASLALYQKWGFTLTGEEFPIYQYSVKTE